MASFIGNSRLYAPEQVNYFIPESVHFSGCLLFHILSSIFYEMTKICFLTIKSLMNINSLHKSGRQNPFRKDKIVTCQVNRFSKLVPDMIQRYNTYQSRIMGVFVWYLLCFFCKKKESSAGFFFFFFCL